VTRHETLQLYVHWIVLHLETKATPNHF